MLVYVLASSDNSKAKMISLSLVLGGGIGNLIDRIFNEGRVIDFMNIGIGSLRTGVFNVADIAISCGVVWLLVISFNTSEKKLAP
jgi:signal peptidase II